MSDQENSGQEKNQQTRRLARLSNNSEHRNDPRPGRYSAFIRRIKIILPLIALGIVVTIFSWDGIRRDDLVPVAEKNPAERNTGRNELLSPRFESLDEKGQPYTITAKRAVQGESDEDLVLLEEPMADMLLNSGERIAAQAEHGAFSQKSQRLLLKDNVKLYHDKGYTMEMSELDVDLQANTAWANVDIRGRGPAGTLEAKGLNADAETGKLVFSGPARLVLYDTGSGKKFNLESLNP